MNNNKIDNLSIAAIRSLCIDEINNHNSGHPGIALGAAPMLYTLYKYHLISNPQEPNWINRDRFILSSGHASSLLYAILHLCGYEIKMDDIKNFRTLNSITPGHPEYKITPGIDATSGPLGQGISQAVGVAMAETIISAQYPSGNKIINHYTYCLLGDGCLEEGISQEAIALAGHYKLKKLIVLYDSNKITLDGDLSLSSSENVKLRFLANNWDVINVNDGNNVKKINNAINKAKKNNKPTLIIINTIIGYGSINQGTSKVHGSPLGEKDGEETKKKYNYNFPKFTIPKEVYENLKKNFILRGIKKYQKWLDIFNKYKKKYSKEYEIFNDAFNLNIEKYIENNINFNQNEFKATRETSQFLINEFAKKIPFLLGGAADVAGSVLTKINNSSIFSAKNKNGKNISFGIREFGMAGIQNGILLHGGLRPYIGCFLVFSDYMKAAIRMSALSKLPSIYLFSHDSIFIGEDGATHQPIEQLAMLRSIPNIQIFRPCDARETFGAWKLALKSKETPTCIILTRQKLPLISTSSDEKIKNGAYIISYEKNDNKKFITIIATGSEVNFVLKIKEKMENKINIRIVSMPSMELFNKLNENEQQKILGNNYDKTIAVEAGTSFGWYRYAKYVMGIDRFGLSANGEEIANFIGFNENNLIKIIKKII